MIYNYDSVFTSDYIAKNPDLGTVRNLECFKDSNNNPLEVYYLKDAFLLSYLGVIFTEDGLAIKGSALNDTLLETAINYAFSLKIHENPAYVLEGEFVSLLGIWSNTFFHWILEFLPKVIIAEKSGFIGKYIVFLKDNYVYETLSLLGIDDKRIVRVNNKEDSFSVENLLIIPRIDIYSCQDYYLEILQEIREKILSHIETTSFEKKKYYISRKNADNGRKIVNEDKVIPLLKSYGIVPVVLEDLPFIEQVKLMENSDCLIGGHGAGMVHSLFMPEGSNIVEFFSPTYINSCFTPIMKLLKHKYNMIVSNVSETSKYLYGEEVMVPINLTKVILENNLHLFL